MEAMKIKNCGNYATVRCVVGDSGMNSVPFSVGDMCEVGNDEGTFLYQGDEMVYESSARFAEVQLSEPDYAPVEQDEGQQHGKPLAEVMSEMESDVLDHARANSPIKPMGNPKYDKTITGKYNTGTCTADVYRILEGFNVTNPQLQHLIKKALNVGARGHKDERQDLVDILHSAQSALDMYDDKNGTK